MNFRNGNFVFFSSGLTIEALKCLCRKQYVYKYMERESLK